MPILDPLKAMSLPPFVSNQVQLARRFFLHLNASPEGPLALVCGGCERVQPDYRVQRTDFPFHCVELIAEGEGEVVLNHKTHPLYPGVVFAYGPGVSHTIRTSQKKTLLKYYVDFTGSDSSSLLQTSCLSAGTVLHVTPVEEIVTLFECLQRDATSDHPVAEELCITLLRLILLKISERAIPAPLAEPKSLASYRRARQLLEKNAHLWRTADEVAAHCEMSPEYLSRLFTKHAHTTPYKLLTRLKMSRAAELLLDSQLKVQEVSEELGFADPFHFSRVFKRIYGASPENFVRRIQGTAPRTNPID